MKHIDKTLNKAKGEQIVTEFLDCVHNRTGAYPADLYKAFGKEIDDAHGHVVFRKRLVDQVLEPEQQGHCCYCMRKLSACRSVTVEHIMPNHAADKAELDLYRTRPTELDGLPHTNDFLASNPKIYPPHPHSVAYQNLVLSCDGDLFNVNTKPVCCNLKRGHAFLPPFVLYPGIEHEFEYDAEGFVRWINDPEPLESRNNVAKVLGLNNFVLRMIRRIWFFCTDHGINPATEESSFVVNTMMGETSMDTNETNMLLNFKKERYWALLLEYDAFAGISFVRKEF